MANATELIEQHQSRLPIRDQVDTNGFLAAARAGEVRPEQLRRFVAGEFLTQDAEMSKYGNLILRHRHEVPAAVFAHLAVLFTAQRRLLADMAAADVGLDPEQLRAADQPPAVQAFSLNETWVGVHAGPAEAALAVHTDFQLFAPVATELVDALGKLSDVPGSVVTYLENYAEEPAVLRERLVEVVEHGLAGGEPEKWLTRSAENVPELLTDYWRYVTG
ncbi:hypothetical protein ABZ816_01865 [Actinosynnema sp. NPDC047251]|uniref:Thiaminase-2/PQQC domain-containing protein n=1 Tax=Saccharothrix espanaensis (strain ATCC 51144 / DSM 44229 / JCM 9112 / NBRC 15066 / NRRL 15764) TaxID=1179773 RepID=K0K2A7_SACES|nr:hypothetical protein [Saccharothrix espanaensis]CCH30999.1 hypothetical protein BN6_37060 [Saccharothrix espanaensis DSM 44229]